MVLQTNSRITNSHSDSLSKSPAASSSSTTLRTCLCLFSFSEWVWVLLSYLGLSVTYYVLLLRQTNNRLSPIPTVVSPKELAIKSRSISKGNKMLQKNTFTMTI